MECSDEKLELCAEWKEDKRKGPIRSGVMLVKNVINGLQMYLVNLILFPTNGGVRLAATGRF